MLKESCAKINAELSARGLTIPCISSGCTLQIPDEAIMDQAKAYIDLAAALHAPYVRVLGDTAPGPSANVDTTLVSARLKELAPYAAEKGVTMLLESNGVYACSELLRKTLDEVAHPAVAALWDINHPVRYAHEDPTTTWNNIGAYVRHVHVKDTAVNENGEIVYKMLGYGTLPIREAFSLLKANGFSGCISLEWTKRWNQELEDAGIVFSHFVYAVKKIWHNA
jgi:fatty-acyl-CoA synthase